MQTPSTVPLLPTLQRKYLSGRWLKWERYTLSFPWKSWGHWEWGRTIGFVRIELYFLHFLRNLDYFSRNPSFRRDCISYWTLMVDIFVILYQLTQISFPPFDHQIKLKSLSNYPISFFMLCRKYWLPLSIEEAIEMSIKYVWKLLFFRKFLNIVSIIWKVIIPLIYLPFISFFLTQFSLRTSFKSD